MQNLSRTLAILMSLCLGSAVIAKAPEKDRVAVMAVQVVGFPEAVVDLFTESLAQGAARNESYSVLSQAQITSILGLEAQKQLLGCTDDSCMAELAGALDARYLITGKVVKLGAVSNLSVSMMDVSKATSVRQEHAEVKEDGEVVKWLRFLGAKVVGIDPGDDLARDVGIVTGPRWKVGVSLTLAGLGTSGPVVLDTVGFDPANADADPSSYPSHPTRHDAQWTTNPSFELDFGYQVTHWLRIDLGYGHHAMEARFPVKPSRLVAFYEEGSDEAQGPDSLRAGCPVVFLDRQAAAAYNAALTDLPNDGYSTLGTLLQRYDGPASPGRLLTESSTVNEGGMQCYANNRIQSISLGVPFVLRPTDFLLFEIGPRVGFGVMNIGGWIRDPDREGNRSAGLVLLGGRVGFSFLFKKAFPKFPVDLSFDLRGTVQYARAFNVIERVFPDEIALDASGEALDPEDSTIEDKHVRVEMPYPTLSIGLGMRF